MSIPCDINPALTLGAIRDSLIAEATTVPVSETIALRRSIMWLIIASLGEVIDRVDALVEGSAAADRLSQELAIARAEIGRLELRATVRELEARPARLSLYDPLPKSREERAHRRDDDRVVYLGDILRREQHDAGRPMPPEGGAA